MDVCFLTLNHLLDVIMACLYALTKYTHCDFFMVENCCKAYGEHAPQCKAIGIICS
jgi:hypothetical protein